MSKRVICIVGEPAMGKSASLRTLANQERILYLNCEANKDLPFAHKFKMVNITDPYQVLDEIAKAEEDGDIDTVVIESITMLMEMFESVHINNAKDTRAAWGEYSQFFKNLMQQYVGPSPLSFIFTAHIENELNEETGQHEMRIPVKGALKKVGIAAFFTVIVQAKRMTIKKIEKYKKDNELLDVSKRDESLGYKYVFQTQTTKETIGDCIRGPFEMFEIQESFMDNDAQALLDVVDDFYAA
jgi:hypothetical protein